MAQTIVVREVRFPIKLKLISVIALLLLASLTLYSYYALTHFKKDKSAYIFESTLSNVESNGNYIESTLNDSIEGMDLILKTFLSVKNEKLLSNIFESNKQLIEIQIYDSDKKLVYGIADKNLLNENSLEDSFFLDLIGSRPLKFENISTPILESFPIKELPHLLIRKFENDHFIFARIKLSKILDLFKNDKQHQNFIVNDFNKIIAEDDLSSVVAGKGFHPETFQRVIKNSQRVGVYKYTEINENKILSFYKITNLSLVILSVIPEAKAYEAASYIIEKSLYFAVFLLSISIIVGIRFSKNLTNPIETLFNGSKDIAAGNFETKVSINSRDEIGALTDSFNFMSDEILRYMDEMKEKLRLEKEVEVAKIVQDAFFPNNSVTLPHLDIAAIHETASECGGDWWGYIDNDDRTVIMIADATGHGVPAALLTATANCSLSMIEQISKTDNTLLTSPAKMMNLINTSVCHVGSQVLMTFFIISIDKKNQKMTYANASHNPPVLYEKKDTEPNKQDLIPLMSKPGARIGHETTPLYEEKEVAYKDGDVLLLFTDGIIEGVNKENKQWGNRRFFKSIIENVNHSAIVIRDNIVKDAKEFFEGIPVDDDVTLLSIKFKKTLNENSNQEDSNISFKKVLNRDIAISKLDDKSNIIKLLGEKNLSYIIGENTPSLEKDLEILEKVLSNNKHWNHEYYSPLNLQSINLKSNKDLSSVISEFTEKIDYSKFFASPIDYIRIVMNELLTNAIYNSSGVNQREAGQLINIPEGDSVTCHISNYEDGIILNVKDTKGNLSKAQIIKALNRSAIEQAPEKKRGGAGLGLFTIVNYANQVIFSLEEGSSTEVTCIFENNKRYKNYRKRITSIHIHELKGKS